MKINYLSAARKTGLPMLLVGLVLGLVFLLNPAGSLAEGRHGGGGGGRSFSGGRESSGSQAFSGARGSAGRQAFSGQRSFSGGQGFSGRQEFSGRQSFVGGRGDRDHDRDRDRGRGGFSFGFYSTPSYGLDFGPYAYGPGYYDVPNSCNPPGFYDQAGYWHAYPGCYVDPNAYPYGY